MAARGRRRGGDHEEGAQVEGAPFWMITYADLVTLMFAFFVLLTTMSNRDSNKVKIALGSIAAALGVMDHGGMLAAADHDATQLAKVPDGRPDPVPGMLQAMHEQLSPYASNDFIQIGRTDASIHVVMNEALLFAEDSDYIQPGAYPFLNEVAETVARTRAQVEVQGHSDDSAPGSRWRSNWDLAAARAVSVIDYLQRRSGAPEGRFRAVSYGAARPMRPNDDERNRARNRRVELMMTVSSARDRYFFGEPRWDAPPTPSAPSGVLKDEGTR